MGQACPPGIPCLRGPQDAQSSLSGLTVKLGLPSKLPSAPPCPHCLRHPGLLRDSSDRISKLFLSVGLGTCPLTEGDRGRQGRRTSVERKTEKQREEGKQGAGRRWGSGLGGGDARGEEGVLWLDL